MRYTFQHQIATGRTTFPVAVLISIALWALPFTDRTELLSLLAGGITTYLLIELNTTFALIRTRTEMPSALFVWLYSSLLFLHPYQHTCWIQLFFMGTLFGLFYSYESRQAPVYSFHAFLFLGLGSLIISDLIWVVSFVLIAMIGLRSLTMRSFFAGIIGLIVPYWVILGYYFIMDFNGQIELEGLGISQLLSQHFGNIVPFSTTFEGLRNEYIQLGLVKGICYITLLMMSIVGTFCCQYNSFNDKVRTRCFISALIPIEISIILLTVLHPSLVDAFLPILIIYVSITCSYLFALIFSRFVYYLLVTVLGLSAALMVLNCWTYLF